MFKGLMIGLIASSLYIIVFTFISLFTGKSNSSEVFSYAFGIFLGNFIVRVYIL